ncbi:50S ribosomal protein L10 [Blochmannia endosymbiont of Colobopsis nipponica]|uniref:50S ribosomal protein L10 n=1 Tax=Blochmannia endosymbiont of Colobopsis nipponica TaxID=2681987 RepID=UPI00177DCC90|nr:50S ribosomal protein L10 [Blochmannia endosymbiont of Colobopsis nipponica]QOI10917.1 50S ribosomal protein L10 [Blochmannia endosymbiont of Colobopsis nipponica]
MILSIPDKQRIVSEVREIARVAVSAVLADPSGLKNNELVELRQESRKKNVYIRVIRNSLLSKIVHETSFECLKDFFSGPTLIGFSVREASDVARLFQDFSKLHENFKIKVAVFEKNIIDASHIDILSSLPTYLEGITRLIFFIKESTIVKLIRVLSLIAEQKK